MIAKINTKNQYGTPQNSGKTVEIKAHEIDVREGSLVFDDGSQEKSLVIVANASDERGTGSRGGTTQCYDKHAEIIFRREEVEKLISTAIQSKFWSPPKQNLSEIRRHLQAALDALSDGRFTRSARPF